MLLLFIFLLYYVESKHESISIATDKKFQINDIYNTMKMENRKWIVSISYICWWYIVCQCIPPSIRICLFSYDLKSEELLEFKYLPQSHTNYQRMCFGKSGKIKQWHRRMWKEHLPPPPLTLLLPSPSHSNSNKRGWNKEFYVLCLFILVTFFRYQNKIQAISSMDKQKIMLIHGIKWLHIGSKHH